MVKQYSKIAIISPYDIVVPNPAQDITVNTNTSFVPKFAFIDFGTDCGPGKFIWDTRHNEKLYNNGGIWVEIKNPRFTAKNITFNMYSAYTSGWIIDSITLIG